MKEWRIDSHQHFWHYNPARHVWMNEAMESLKTDFLPADLAPHLWACALDGCVAVQADQSEEENTFLLDLAEKHQFIKGIVGWVDLQADNLAERLEHYRQFPKLKGFRHVLHDACELPVDTPLPKRIYWVFGSWVLTRCTCSLTE